MKIELDTKTDNKITEQLIDRLNKQEESLASVHAQLKVLAEQAADSDNDQPQIGPAVTGGGGVDKEALNQLSMKMDRENKKLTEMIMNLQNTLNA